MRQMDVAELQAVLADEDLRDTVQLVDVREAWEEQEARLPGFTLLPLSRCAPQACNRMLLVLCF